MHNPRLAHFLPRVTNPTLDRVGARGPDRARRLRRAVPTRAPRTRRYGARALRPPAAHRAARRFRRASCSTSSEERRGGEALLLQRDAAPRVSRTRRATSTRRCASRSRTASSTARRRAANYQRYLDRVRAGRPVGFDGLMINEHHSTPSCVNVGANMTAAVLARTTSRAKILHPRQHPADRGQPRADGRADRHGRPDLGRPRALRLRARRGRGDVVGELQPRPQPRALRGVPRPDPEVLDGARARSAGRAGTTTSAT